MLYSIETLNKQSTSLDSLHSCKILTFFLFFLVKSKKFGYEVFNATSQVVVRSFFMSDNAYHEENRIHIDLD